MPLLNCQPCKQVLQVVRVNDCRAFIVLLMALRRCLNCCQTWLLEDPRSNIKDGGVIALVLTTELDECKELLLNADGVLKNMEEERAATGINNLKIQYNRNSGYTIEVSNQPSR